jgi:hypothetical protein
LRDLVDEVICVVTPELFLAVGEWYEDFSQTSDADVRELLSQAAGTREWVTAMRRHQAAAGPVTGRTARGWVMAS